MLLVCRHEYLDFHVYNKQQNQVFALNEDVECCGTLETTPSYCK
jgi:hypothetical protein